MLAVSQDIVINFHRARILGIFVGPPILYQHCPLHNLTRRRGSRLKLKLTHFAAALLLHSPIFCVDFLICRNCRMYLFNLQSYLKNYTLCTPPPYPPMIVPCWCASYLSKLLNVFVSIEKMYFSICKIISTINTLCYSSIHQSLFHQFLPQTFCVDWKVFFCQRKFKFYAKDQSFMHCFGRRGLWNELWCLGKHGGPVFTTIQTSAKTKSLPDNDDDGYHYCHAFVTIFK